VSAADIKPLHQMMREFRAKVVLDAVMRLDGNVCRAAKRLGCHRNLIYYYLRKNGTPLTSAKLRRVQKKLKLTAQSLQQF